jgi:hypothetical protein
LLEFGQRDMKKKGILKALWAKTDVIFGATPLVIRVVLVFAVVAAVIANYRSMQLSRLMRGRMNYCIAEIQNCKTESDNNARYLTLLSKEHATLRDAAIPLVRLAQERFGGKDPTKALEQLAEELGVRSEGGAETSTMRLPRWLQAKTVDSLAANLRGQSTANAKVLVSLGRSGDMQYVLSSDLVRLLRGAGLKTSPGKRRVRWAKGMKRIQFYYGTEAKGIAQGLSAGLVPFLQGGREILLDKDLAPQTVRIVLHGTPKIQRSGVVRLD